MSAVTVALGIYPLRHRTYFEIRELCEAQNRGPRPWLGPVPQQTSIPTDLQRHQTNTNKKPIAEVEFSNWLYLC